MEPAEAVLWARVGALVGRVSSLEDLRVHHLGPLALAFWPEQARPVPDALVAEARVAARSVLAAPLLLERVRAACRGTLVLMKGPEVAARYPHPAMRPFTDLDLLAPDPVTAQRSLITAGFQPVGDERLYRNIHHLRPLHLPGFPLVVEIHARPKWVDGLPLPPVDELFEEAVPAVVPVEGLLALPRPQHSLVLAAHSWAHEPLGSLRQLIDIAAVSAEVPVAEIEGVAARWGLERLWSTTARVTDALFGAGDAPWPFRTWARNVPRARERIVLEVHLERWLSGFSVHRGPRAAAEALSAVRNDLTPGPDETWRLKRRRLGFAVRNAFRPQGEHDARLEDLELLLPNRPPGGELS